MKFTVTADDLTDLKYLITEELVSEGLIQDCTDTDEDFEVDTENAIKAVFEKFFKTEL